MPDDAQLLAIYGDPTLTPGQKLELIQGGGEAPALGMSVAPQSSALPPAPYALPAVAELAPNVGGAGGTTGFVLPQGAQGAPGALQPTAIPLTPAVSAGGLAPGPRIGTTTLLTPQVVRQPALPRAAAAPPTVPDWLRRYMGPELEGQVVRPRTLTVQPLSKEGQVALAEAETEAFGAKREQGEAQIQAAENIAQETLRQAHVQERVAQAFADRERVRQNELRRMEQDYRAMADEAVATPITEPSFWGGEDVGSQILGRLALFLGTIGSAASGQPNLVWEKMQRDVERNIEVQKTNKALKQSRLAAEGSLVDMARQRFVSEAAIDQAMRESAYEKIRAQLASYAETAKTPERKAALEAVMAEADKELTLQSEQRRAAIQQGEINERAARAAQQTRPDALTQLVKRTELLARGAKAQRELEGKPAAGESQAVPLWNVAVPKNIAPEAIKASAAYRQIHAELAKYRQRGPATAGTVAAQNRLVILLKKGAGPGFSSDVDMKLLAEQVPDPSNPQFAKRMDEFEAAIRAQEQADKESVGASPAFTPTTERK